MWPLQPEPAPRPEPGARIEPVARAEPPPRPHRVTPPPLVEDPAQWSEPEPPASAPPPPQRERRARGADPLAGLAEESARAPVTDPGSGEQQPVRQPPRREPRPARPAPAPAPPAEAEVAASTDQNLAEMAQRLEAALRRPPRSEDGRSAPPATRTEPAAATTEDPVPEPPASSPPRATLPAEPARPSRGEPRAGRASGGQPAPQKSLYDSLEQEMASLLGRPVRQAVDQHCALRARHPDQHLAEVLALQKAEERGGRFSMPSTTCSRYCEPAASAAIHRPRVRDRRAGRRIRETRNRAAERSCAATDTMSGPGTGAVALYCAISPHTGMRAKS